MKINLQEFIRKTIDEINAGLPDGNVVDGSIQFEVSITSSSNKNGGIDIKVVSGKLEEENELVQTVAFAVVNQNQKEASDEKSGQTIIKYIDQGMKVLNSHSQKKAQLAQDKERNRRANVG